MKVLIILNMNKTLGMTQEFFHICRHYKKGALLMKLHYQGKYNLDPETLPKRKHHPRL